MKMAFQQQFRAAPIFVPSPPGVAERSLVGEGSTVSQFEHTWESGRHTLRSRSWLPLSRLRFAQAPSPPRGEGILVAPIGASS
jgi:hypothetical protein